MRAQGFPPIVREDARILILGSLPGLASLKLQQYYAHPQNTFWRIIEKIFAIPAQAPYAQRCVLLCEAQIALWDVCQAAQRVGSLDCAIEKQSIITNDIDGLLKVCPHIQTIAFNGKAAAQLFQKHMRLQRKVITLTLPSTSPAHAALSLAEKLSHWQQLQRL